MAACDVELIAHHRPCGATPARYFEAECGCGHLITGYMCEACAVCRTPGCNDCWASGQGHVCAVQFTMAECLCGCGNEVPLASRNQSRDGKIRGRPLRFLPGHHRILEAAGGA